jgi:hypothetical protein
MSVRELETAPFGPEPEPGRVVEFPAAGDGELPPDDRDLARAWRWLGVVVVGLCVLAVLLVLDPRLLLRNTTPNGGDMGAHVWFPAFLRDHLLPRWRVAGWSNAWFGGFPAGQFYFPLPALMIVALGTVLPYSVAFKLVTALGPLTLPAAAYGLGRGLRVRRPGPELFAVAATMFLFFRGVDAATGTHAADIQYNQRIMGGTLVSMLAGEFSFSIALSFALLALGALAYSLRTGRRAWLPTVLLAATVLSHVVVAIFAAVAALVIWLLWGPLRRFGTAALIGAVAALLTAFWSLPLLATFSYTSSMRYTKLTWYLDYLFGSAPEPWWVFLFALGAVVVAVVRRDRAVLALSIVAVVFAAVFRWWPELHAWNLRFLPFWYLTVFLVAAAGVGELVRAGGQQLARAWIGAPPGPDEHWEFDEPREGRRFRVVKTTAVVVLVVIVTGAGLTRAYAQREFLDFWAEWNYSGFQDTSASSTKPKSWPEYHALMQRMGELPAGRAIWEGGGSAIDAYGTPLALMLLPYWTDGRIGSIEGLYYESAASLPYDFMAIAPLSGAGNASNPVRGLDYRSLSDFSLGVRYARMLGVRYYLAHSDDAKARADQDPGLRLVDTVPDRDGKPPGTWNIYEVRDAATVAPLDYEPVVVTPKAGKQSECFGRPPVEGTTNPELGAWECTAAGWWNTPSALDRPFAAGGPAGWARASARAAASAPKRRLPTVDVTRVHTRDDSISFHVSRPGVPVVVRTSYFPNWQAQGARGPWRLTPNLMVVVPTSSDVTLRFERSGAEKLGIALTVVGVAALGAMIWWDGRRGRRRPGAADDGPREGAGAGPLGGPAEEPFATPPG